jgi:phage terminase large subunit
MADYSRPEIIREIQNSGFNCLNANKEVKKGIDLVKSKIVYYSGENINREYENYKWKKKQDTILDEPVKLFDDAMDAIRYANHHICTNINSNNTYQAF